MPGVSGIATGFRGKRGKGTRKSAGLSGALESCFFSWVLRNATVNTNKSEPRASRDGSMRRRGNTMDGEKTEKSAL